MPPERPLELVQVAVAHAKTPVIARDERIPLLSRPGKLPPAGRGQPVHPPPPAVCDRPRARDGAGRLELVEGRVDRAFGEVEDAVAPPAQLLDDGVAVTWPVGEHREDQSVDVAALQGFGMAQYT